MKLELEIKLVILAVCTIIAQLTVGLGIESPISFVTSLVVLFAFFLIVVEEIYTTGKEIGTSETIQTLLEKGKLKLDDVIILNEANPSLPTNATSAEAPSGAKTGQ